MFAASRPAPQDQDCFGGCFSSNEGFKGDMAAVRVWDRALGMEEVRS